MSDVSLIIIGHGSHFNPNSSVPVRRLAARLRRDEAFAQVQVAFWKEQPSLHEVLRHSIQRRVVVVPYFMSAGYFADRVGPRELGLGAVDFGQTVEVHGRYVTYTAPVGTHPAMTDILRERVRSICGPPSTSPEPGSTTVLLVGHGTSEHDASEASTKKYVERGVLKAGYASVRGSFLDAEPLLENVVRDIDTKNVVVVPYFTANGLHTEKDVPEILGLPDNWSEGVPQRIAGECGEVERVWYGHAVGTDAAMRQIVIDRARRALEHADEHPRGEVRRVVEARATFADWVRQRPRTLGQLELSWSEEGWRIRPEGGSSLSQGAGLADAESLERLLRFADDGSYRALAYCRDLPTDWQWCGDEAGDFCDAVSTVYPGAITTWYEVRLGDFDSVAFDETLARQSGRYAVLQEADVDAVEAVSTSLCDRACVRNPRWTFSGEPVSDSGGASGLACGEACSVFRSRLRAHLMD